MKTTRRALLAICAALVIGCAGSPSRTAEVPAVPGALPPGPAQAAAATGYDHPAWQQLIAAARNEGKLIMRGAPNPEAREDIPRAFKERFGVEIEWDSARASDLYSRLESERVSGLYSMDVVISGNDLALMLQKGWLEPLRPLLVVPEVSDPSAWRNNRLPFVDPEQQFMFQLERAVYGSWAINPQAVDESELRTLDDVLNPKWKGKLSVDDPTVAGLGELNAVYLYLE